MGSTLSTTVVVLFPVLGSIYQFALAPIIQTGGVFRKVELLNNHDCHIVPELNGCEKIVFNSQFRLMYMACSRISARPYWLSSVGHLNASGRPLDDHVATYDLATGQITRLQIKDYGNAARGLQVHGMDVVPSASDPSLLYVYMVNHRAPLVGRAEDVGADSSIEIFSTQVGTSAMKHIATVEDSVIATPNDVIGFPDGESFYFTNDHGAKTGYRRMLERYLRLAYTSVGYCHADHGCKIAAGNLKGVNGIVKSPSNDTVYVGSSTGAGLYILDPQADNTLLLSDSISTDGIPMDNLSFDKNGALWAAYFPRALDVLSRFKDLSVSAATGAYRFTTNFDRTAHSGEKYNVDRVFEDDGGIAQSATTIVYIPERRQLFLHGISAPHMTICNL